MRANALNVMLTHGLHPGYCNVFFTSQVKCDDIPYFVLNDTAIEVNQG